MEKICSLLVHLRVLCCVPVFILGDIFSGSVNLTGF
jgi:hypothetical protein